MSRPLLLLVLVAAVGCDRPPVAGPAPSTTGEPAIVADPPKAPPAIDAKERDRLAAAAAAEEKRLELLNAELRLLDQADRDFVLQNRPRMAARPIQDLEPDDEPRFARLAKFFPKQDVRAHYIAIAELYQASAIARALKLEGDEIEAFQVHFGMQILTPQRGTFGHMWLRALRESLLQADRVGLSGISAHERDDLRQAGFARFLVNVKN